MKRGVDILLLLLFVVGIFGSGSLVIEEIQTGNGCPKIIGIPACLIILICFVVPLILHLIKKYNSLYFFFTVFAANIALIASILELTEVNECPKTAQGTPMCFYSLLLFTGLIVLKLYKLKKIKSKKWI